MSDWVKDVSFDDGDEDVQKGRPDTYKGEKKGQTDRVAIVYRKKDEDGKWLMETVNFKFVNAHYHDNVGYVICDQGYCCERLGAPKGRIATIVIVYVTDRDGNIDKANFGKYQILPWIINGDKYHDLKRRNKENPLHKKDLEVTCKDPQYQKLDIIPSGDCVWLKVDGLPEKVMAQVKKIEDQLPGLLGRKMSTDDLKEQLGESTEAVAESNDSVDYSDVLSQL